MPKQVFLNMGEALVCQSPSHIKTILGSCVAVILYSRPGKPVAMCHYVHARRGPKDPVSTDFGDVALAQCYEKLLALGTQPTALRAQLYGAGNVLNDQINGRKVCDNNIQVAMDFLKDRGIPIEKKDLRGKRGREVTFDTENLNTLVKAIRHESKQGMEKVFQMIQSLTGHEEKTNNLILQTVVEKRIRETGSQDFEGYEKLLSKNSKEVDLLVHLSTNHSTSFFRYPQQLKRIAKLAQEKDERLKILSAGSSSGQEAYSIAAFLLKQGFSNFQVRGLDVDPESIKRAKEGAYGNPDWKGIPAEYQGCFTRKDQGFEVNLELKAQVQFERWNLLKLHPVIEASQDVVLCNNVLIYFAPDNTRRILGNLKAMLKPGGILLLGQRAPQPLEGMEELGLGIFRNAA